MRAWTGWLGVLGLIMALGPGCGRRDGTGDAGMTGMCPLWRANVSSSWPDVSAFRRNVSTSAGRVLR
ncbi:MAG: hypothetical protein OXP73_11285 [Chloroflexota bacterium]|nr:hypothetical protein [Chloroflexota bacterium]